VRYWKNARTDLLATVTDMGMHESDETMHSTLGIHRSVLNLVRDAAAVKKC